ncbi:MAG: glycoside hydrolase family 43 protein [Ruminiclostridium sp.]
MTEQMFKNPIVEQRADPWVYKHIDGYYYFTASVPEYDRIEIRRSKTIEGIGNSQPTIIWKKHVSGPMSKHIWAPEIHNIDGKWYIYFAAGETEDIWKIRPYVLECTDSDPLTGKWTEKGIIQSTSDNISFTDFSLDSTSFEHNGKRYLVWAQKVAGVSNLYIAQMSNPWTISTEQVMISTPSYAWEKVGYQVNEGPAVIVKNGKIFMSYSASATDYNYCMGLLTADATADLLKQESWKKESEPVFKSNEQTSQYGPGHSCFTVSEDGKQDILIYHSRNYKEIQGDPLYDPNRHTCAQVLKWNADGTPSFGIPQTNYVKYN